MSKREIPISNWKGGKIFRLNEVSNLIFKTFNLTQIVLIQYLMLKTFGSPFILDRSLEWDLTESSEKQYTNQQLSTILQIVRAFRPNLINL